MWDFHKERCKTVISKSRYSSIRSLVCYAIKNVSLKLFQRFLEVHLIVNV